MGNRLSRIYTRTGDDGSTGLGGNLRVAKDHPRVTALGDIDETSAAIGLVLAVPGVPTEVASLLAGVQHDLFDFGADLAYPLDAEGDKLRIRESHIIRLEALLDQYNAELAPLKEFILPGGSPAAAACHLARTICRRAERSTITLAHGQALNPLLIMYLNRLSDLLFVLARILNEQGRSDVLWQPDRFRPPA